MAFNLGTTSVQETVRYVAAYLDDITGCSRALVLQAQHPEAHERQSSLTLFHARSVPTIDLETYLSRILKYCPCQSEVFLSLIVYMQQMIDRCARRRMPFAVDAYSIHRLLITGVTIASKWFSDVFFTNSRYAKVGGLPVAELNSLELQYLSMIDFELNIQPEVLQTIGMDLFCGTLPKFVNAQFDRLSYDLTQQQNYVQRSERRHMSYPGPSDIYYNTPCAYQAPQYCNVQSTAKHANAYGTQNHHPSSGSTLASSSPGDTAAIAAYQQGVV